MPRKARLKVQSEIVHDTEESPLVDFITHDLKIPLVGLVGTLSSSYCGVEKLIARSAIFEVGNNRYLGGTYRSPHTRGFGINKFIAGLGIEFECENGASNDCFYAAAGLDPGREDQLIRAGWPAVSVEEVEGLSDDEQRLARASAKRCALTPSGLRRPTAGARTTMHECIRHIGRRGRVYYRYSADYADEIDLDVSDLTAPQRTVLQVIVAR
jgi:hypothetical protein